MLAGWAAAALLAAGPAPAAARCLNRILPGSAGEGPVMAVGLRHLRSQVPGAGSRLLKRKGRSLAADAASAPPAACELIASRLA